MAKRLGGSRSVAVVTIKDAAMMTMRGRKNVAKWLRQQAAGLMKDGASYAKAFRARYLYAS